MESSALGQLIDNLREPSALQLVVEYLKSHPLVAVAVVVVTVLLLGSIIRRLVRFAVLLCLLLLVGLYWTHREAASDWQTRAALVKRQAEQLGKEALERGGELLEEGKEQLSKQAEKAEKATK